MTSLSSVKLKKSSSKNQTPGPALPVSVYKIKDWQTYVKLSDIKGD